MPLLASSHMLASRWLAYHEAVARKRALDPSIEEGNDAGAAGDTSSSINFSTGAMIGVVIVVIVVILIGVSTASLFLIAKRREWTVKETIKRSAHKVANALTPRRAEFPREIKESMGYGGRGRSRGEDVPPTPRLNLDDLEKGKGSGSGIGGGSGRGSDSSLVHANAADRKLSL